MLAHHALRLLKLGTALSDPILKLGRSILAGCKRSTQLARVYTLRMVEKLANTHTGMTSLYINVEDISTLTIACSGKQVVARATKFTNHLAEWAKLLKLDISDKTAVISDNKDSREFASNASKLGIPMKVEKPGIDRGVGASSASRRVTNIIKGRSITSKGPC